MTVLVLPIILRSLPNHRANPCSSGSADNRSLQAAAKHRAQRSAACCTDQRTFTRTNPVISPVVIMVRTIMAVVIVPATPATAHAVVISTVAGVIVMLLRKPGNNRKPEEKRSDKNYLSKTVHLQLDAEKLPQKNYSICNFF